MKTPQFQASRRLRGFSLVELLVVITIIVILTGLTIGAMGWVNKKAAIDKARTQMALLENGLEQYKADVGSYPEGNSSMDLYMALFGDGVGEDGILGTDDDTSPDGRPDEGARVYIADLDPNTNPRQMVEVRNNRPTKLIDPFGSEWNYESYPPGSSGHARMNNPDFDLSSSGPDGRERWPGGSATTMAVGQLLF